MTVLEAFESIYGERGSPEATYNNLTENIWDCMFSSFKAGRESMRVEVIKACEERTDRIEAIKEIP